MPGSAIATGGVGTTQLADDAVTAAKLGNESTVDLVTTLPATGAFTGQLALDTDDLKVYCWDGSSWQSIKAAGSINAVVGGSTGIVNITVTTSGDTVTINTTLDNTSAAAQFLAGPTATAGAVSYRTIAAGDLPTATTGAKGAVQVNGNGLSMSGDTIQIANTVTANSSVYHLVQYTSKGLVTGGRTIQSGDLPLAGASSVGGVYPGTGLSVAVDGQLNHSNTVTPGTYPKVTFNAQGHITSGQSLVEADIPNIPATKLTSGTLSVDVIGNNTITGAKLANYSTVRFGGASSTSGIVTFPVPEFTGQQFFDSTNGDLYIYDGNTWQPITVISGDLVYAGTYNAATNTVKSVTTQGSAVGLVVGLALPAASAANIRYYVVVADSGNGVSPAPAVALAPPDMIISNGATWDLVDVSNAIAGQIATNISFTPYAGIASTNVQTALQELEDEKLAKAGGTVTGNLEIGTTGSLTFEGSTTDGFETTLGVVDPTGDRTILLPNASGTLLTTGDTGVVTSTMIADGTIVNADVNASAAIAGTKISPDFGGQNVTTTGLFVHGVGSATAPTITFTGDPNTGLYSPGADQVAISTGGAGRLFVDANGNVGLKTSSPFSYGAAAANLANLQVEASQFGVITLGSTTGGADQKYWRMIGRGSFLEIQSMNDAGTAESSAIRINKGVAAQTSSVQFYAEDGLRATIAASSSVVGGAAVATATPTSFTLDNTYKSTSPSWDTLKFNLFKSTTEAYGFGVGNASDLHYFAGGAATGAHAFYTSRTERLRITSDGKVGIGTSSPNNKLYVQAIPDTSSFDGITLNNGTRDSIGLYTTGASYSYGAVGGSQSFLYCNQGDLTICSDDTGVIKFAGDVGAERARIDSSGRLLVGASTARSVATISCGSQIESATYQLASQSITNIAASALGPYLMFGKARSTSAGLVSDGDELGSIFFAGGDGTDVNSIGAKISANVDGAPGNNDMPGRLIFSTTSDGLVSPVERMRIDSSGRVGIGATPLYPLHVERAQEDLLALVNSGVVTYRFQVKADASLAVVQNTAERVRIDGSGRLLVGTSTSLLNEVDGGVQLQGTVGDAYFTATRFSTSATGSPGLVLGRSKSATKGTNTIVADGDRLGDIAFTGADGSGYIRAAGIQVFVDGTPGANDMPGRLVFSTTADGAATPTERLRIASTGRVTLANSSVGTPTALTDAATIAVDLALANHFTVTLGGNRTLGAPTNVTAGQSGVIVITQDGTGSKTLAYSSIWKFPGGTAPTLTTAANAVDILVYYVESATRISARLISDTK